MANTPYRDGVQKYVDAGWSGIIPIRPMKKTPALSDITGYSGHQLTPEESLEHASKRQLASCNLGLRLPWGVVGVDVDDYGDKHGGDTLRSLEEELGELPPAPYSTARGAGVSGIRFFRVPEDLDFDHVFGPEIECIRFAHRFAVVAPSLHPTAKDEDDRPLQYRWYNPDNTLMSGPPRPEELPPLPLAWVERFGHPPRERKTRVGDFSGVEDFFRVHDSGEHTRYLEAAKRLFDPGSGCRHDTMLKALGCAMRDAAAGMYPARDAVEQLQELWVEATDGEDRGSEFSDLVERACSDAATEEVDLYRKGLIDSSSPVPVLGTNQSNVVLVVESPDPDTASYLAEFAPEGMDLVWTRDLSAVTAFGELSGKKVHVVLSEDPARDRKSYERGETFASKLSWVSASAWFMESPSGVAEVLRSLDSDETRKHVFKTQLEDRSLETKPASKRPTGNVKKDSSDSKDDSQLKHREKIMSDLGNRTHVELCGDRKIDNDKTIAGVKKKWDGRKVFSYGNAIARVRDDQILPQDKSMWMRTLVEACKFTRTDSKGVIFNAEPPGYVVSSTLSCSEDFVELEGIKHAPFVRSDGTVCQEVGYDPESKMKLYLSEDLSGIEVPENPTKEEVVAAREVLEDWLYDFFQIMPTQTDRANALALVLTPFIRGSVPVVPMCVVNGLQHGVGKNKFANGIATLYTGKSLIPKTFTTEDEEQRKQLMSIFREGSDFVCFDETHVVDGKSLAQALTAQTWSDRILGVSQIAEYPNNATWMSLGNNVRVEGDCVRRVYQVQLKPTSPNPENRTASDFRHPDFENWTAEVRKDLLVAVLTVIRGWYAAGKPRPSKEASFGSFEIWESLIRGILEYAGVEGFLDNQQEFRGSSSTTTEFWIAHLEWLHETFEGVSFTTAQVHQNLIQQGPESEPPPGMEDTSPRSYPRELGKQYGRMKDRFLGDYQLVKTSERSKRSHLWKVVKVGD